jgi:hypothetical protein
MLAVDGVISGNSRCGLDGLDCNRQWAQSTPITSALFRLLEGRKVVAVLDLHGHSKHVGWFGYSCRHEDNDLLDWMARSDPRFQYNYSSFGVHPSKSSTARAVLFQALPGAYSLTI